MDKQVRGMGVQQSASQLSPRSGQQNPLLDNLALLERIIRDLRSTIMEINYFPALIGMAPGGNTDFFVFVAAYRVILHIDEGKLAPKPS